MKKRNPSFPHQAAKLSFWAPIMSFMLGMFTRGVTENSRSTGIVIGVISLLLITAGFIFACYALYNIKTHGKEGILGYSVFGILLNGILLFGIVSYLINIPKFQEIQRQQALRALVSNIDATLPQMVDEMTRLDDVALTAENEVQVRFTVTPARYIDIDLVVWNQETVPQIQASVVHSPFYQFSKSGTKLKYLYYSNDGTLFSEFYVDSEDK